MSNFFCKLLTFCCLLFTGFCFLKAGAGLVSDNSDLSLTEVEAAVPARITQQRLQTTPIQQMRPGMRLVGRNPDRWDTQSVVEPDLESWRLVSVRMEQQQPGQFVLGQLLRPLSWIRQNDALPGAVIQLEIPEMHVAGEAEVLSISDCPPIDPGDGPVVLSTFKNVAKNVLDIYVEGEAEPIGVTAGHPIWSEDRQAFIHSDQLQPGERLRSALGKTVRITSIEIRAGPEPVYNLEVAGEHVYSVTDSGLLVHNFSDCDLVTKIGLPDGSYIDLNAPARSTAGLNAPKVASNDILATPNRLQNKLAAWQRYKAEKGLTSYTSDQFTRWSKQYGQFAVNRSTGAWRESISRRMGLGEPGGRYHTPVGDRIPDAVDGIILNEIKNGRVTFTPFIRKQIGKDFYLQRRGYQPVWHFHDGASKRVLDQLETFGIPYHLQ